jgi:hypothetical protein
MAQSGSTSALLIKNKDAIVMPSVHWKKRLGFCHHLDWHGSILLKPIKLQAVLQTPSAPLLALSNWVWLRQRQARRRRNAIAGGDPAAILLRRGSHLPISKRDSCHRDQ